MTGVNNDTVNINHNLKIMRDQLVDYERRIERLDSVRGRVELNEYERLRAGAKNSQAAMDKWYTATRHHLYSRGILLREADEKYPHLLPPQADSLSIRQEQVLQITRHFLTEPR